MPDALPRPPGEMPGAGVEILPWLFCRDVEASVEWLVHAFGFERRTLITAPNGAGYAEIALEGHVVMLGTPPDGGPVADDPCRHGAVVVLLADADRHALQAEKAGAIIEQPFGPIGTGTGYRARDPDGHLWIFMSPAT